MLFKRETIEFIKGISARISVFEVFQDYDHLHSAYESVVGDLDLGYADGWIGDKTFDLWYYRAKSFFCACAVVIASKDVPRGTSGEGAIL